jgi:hypothetical protein
MFAVAAAMTPEQKRAEAATRRLTGESQTCATCRHCATDPNGFGEGYSEIDNRTGQAMHWCVAVKPILGTWPYMLCSLWKMP